MQTRGCSLSLKDGVVHDSLVRVASVQFRCPVIRCKILTFLCPPQAADLVSPPEKWFRNYSSSETAARQPSFNRTFADLSKFSICGTVSFLSLKETKPDVLRSDGGVTLGLPDHAVVTTDPVSVKR